MYACACVWHEFVKSPSDRTPCEHSEVHIAFRKRHVVAETSDMIANSVSTSRNGPDSVVVPNVLLGVELPWPDSVSRRSR